MTESFFSILNPKLINLPLTFNIFREFPMNLFVSVQGSLIVSTPPVAASNHEMPLDLVWSAEHAQISHVIPNKGADPLENCHLNVTKLP